MVEFYADWCGYCRAFVPFYKDFAQQVSGWGDVSRVAAINCADSFNAEVCRRNSVTHFPRVKVSIVFLGNFVHFLLTRRGSF
jgi:thiol-disulfide isomerase/thioredoxin